MERTRSIHYYYEDRGFRTECFHGLSSPPNAVYAACTYGSIEMLGSLLRSPLNVLDCRVSNGMNCLVISAYHGHYELNQELYSHAMKVRNAAIWTPTLITRMAKGCPNAEVMVFLLRESQDFPITSSTLLATIGNASCGAELMRFLLGHRNAIDVIGGVLEALAAESATLEVLELRMCRFKEAFTSKTILKAVAGARICTAETLKTVIASFSQEVVNEDFVIILLSNMRGMNHSVFEHMMEVLFSHKPSCPTTS